VVQCGATLIPVFAGIEVGWQAMVFAIITGYDTVVPQFRITLQNDTDSMTQVKKVFVVIEIIPSLKDSKMALLNMTILRNFALKCQFSKFLTVQVVCFAFTSSASACNLSGEIFTSGRA